jgi:PAS domain S-box-containing protein
MADNQVQRLAEEIQFTSDMALVLFQSSPDAIVVTDSEGRIRMVNPQAELLFGWHHSEMRGQPVEMLLPEDQRARHEQHRHTFLDDPRVRPMGISLHLQALRKDERRVDVDINLSPVVTAHGLFVIATIRRTRPGDRPLHTVIPSISSAP